MDNPSKIEYYNFHITNITVFSFMFYIGASHIWVFQVLIPHKNNDKGVVNEKREKAYQSKNVKKIKNINEQMKDQL